MSHKRWKYGPEAIEAFDVVDACQICDQPIEGRGKNIDHDHTTGKFRGILCTRCNNGLGMFKDDLDLFQKAMQYLKKSKEDMAL